MDDLIRELAEVRAGPPLFLIARHFRLDADAGLALIATAAAQGGLRAEVAIGAPGYRAAAWPGATPADLGAIGPGCGRAVAERFR